jgi:adenylate cyclase
MPEIERKFVVRRLPQEVGDQPGVSIRQGYLSVKPAEVRIRSQDEARHELTVKSTGGLTRTEVTVPVTGEQFDELWPLVEGEIEKTRHTLPHDGRTVEVDVYGGKLQGLLVAEVEFPSEDEAASFVPPSWFGAEVTSDPRYRNSALAGAERPPGAPA